MGHGSSPRPFDLVQCHRCDFRRPAFCHLGSSHFNQDSLSTYNGIGLVTIEGAVLVRPSRPATFHYGDRVRVTGQLSAPPEFATFSYADFLTRQGVYSMIDRPQVSVLAKDQGGLILTAIYTFKDRAREQVRFALQEGLLPNANRVTQCEKGCSSPVRTSLCYLFGLPNIAIISDSRSHHARVFLGSDIRVRGRQFVGENAA